MKTAVAAAYLLELARAAEYADDNPFRTRAFMNAAGRMDALAQSVPEFLDCTVFEQVPGIGGGIMALLNDWIAGDFSALTAARQSLPAGFAEMARVSGLGAKKIRQLKETLDIGTVDELLAAARVGQLLQIKGFGPAVIARVVQSAEDVIAYRGLRLLPEALSFAEDVRLRLQSEGIVGVPSGEIRRTMELISAVEFVVVDHPGMGDFLAGQFPDAAISSTGETYEVLSPGQPRLRFYSAASEHLALRLFETTGPTKHVEAVLGLAGCQALQPASQTVAWCPASEEEIYSRLGLAWVDPVLRDWAGLIIPSPGDLSVTDIKGVLHVHSDYSDGRSPLEEMVNKARRMGYRWLGISDHSVSAHYAGGLGIDAIRHQHDEIDRLNEKYRDIEILKGIESDILADGSLDYPDDVLALFDFVIASVHSRMEMGESQMTARITRALEHPATTVLGHPTGRVLLARRPYRVDMDAVLAAAVAHGVLVELNANPQRLDLDWRLIPEFLKNGGRLSINPDAHSASGMDDINYGIMMAAKAGVKRNDCINTCPVEQVRGLLKRHAN